MKLYVVGIGPGSREQMTGQALAVLETCQVIAGYKTYVELVRPWFPNKEYIVTAMLGERERCVQAVERALEGCTVAMVCSGDAGVYGMAGLVYEVAQNYPPLEIEVVSGVTAACAGAALLGAPLMHDFAVISLSDLLTPWELIERRLELAAQGDFCLCLYNPASKKRTDHLRRACGVVLRHRSPHTPAGWVRSIGREGEEARVLTLGELQGTPVDMFTTVFVGNSQTKVLQGKLVTPRGYRGV